MAKKYSRWQCAYVRTIVLDLQDVAQHVCNCLIREELLKMYIIEKQNTNALSKGKTKGAPVSYKKRKTTPWNSVYCRWDFSGHGM